MTALSLLDRKAISALIETGEAHLARAEEIRDFLFEPGSYARELYGETAESLRATLDALRKLLEHA